jgi:hypothetical protein
MKNQYHPGNRSKFSSPQKDITLKLPAEDTEELYQRDEKIHTLE